MKPGFAFAMSLLVSAIGIPPVLAQAASTPAPAPAETAARPTIRRVEGFSMPMGVVHDPVGNRFFVANAADGGVSMRGKGFISALDANGDIVTLKWAKGLNAPKGMRIRDGLLYVADRGRVVAYDLANGRMRREWSFDGAYNLVDLSFADDGTLYAVDNGKAYGDGAIYRVTPGGAPKLVARGARFLNPLSVEYLDGDLVIGPEIGGNVLRVDTSGEMRDVVAMPMERLQGTVVRPGNGVGGLRRIAPHVVAASNRESGTIAILDLSGSPPRPIARVEELAGEKGISFTTALADRRKQGEGNFGVDKIASGSTVTPVDPSVFTVAGLSHPGKFALDEKNKIFIVPEIGKNRIAIFTAGSAWNVIKRRDPLLY